MPDRLEIPAVVLSKLQQLFDQHAHIARQLEDPAITADHRKVRELSIQKSSLDDLAANVARLQSLLRDEREYLAVIASRSDKDLLELAQTELPRVQSEAIALLEKLKGSLVNSEDNQIGSVILELRAGTGGDEAALWTRDLLEMLTKYASRRGWSIETLDLTSESSAGGLRSATLNIRGPGVWSALNFEAGVHSVKRVPATEAAGRIHTSTATVAVLPEPEQIDVKIDWAKDVIENVTTSQGPGGQNVNKVATAVQLHHKPSGIVIRMQESKSQQQNRERAKRLLATKLYELERQKKHAERSAARSAQIGGGDRSEKIRTYRYKEGIVADERLPGEYALRDLQAGEFEELHRALIEQETQRRIAAL